MVNQSPGQPQYQYEWQNPTHRSFDFGKVFGRAFSGVFADIKPLLIGLLVVGLFTVGLSVMTTGATQDMVANPNNMDMGTFYLVTFGGNLISLLMIVWFQLIVIHTAYAKFTGDELVGQNVIGKALRFTLPMFVIAFIYSLVCILGFYALLIGFVFVWPGWALAGPVYVFERKGVFGSLGRAWTLARNYKRWILLFLFVLSLIASVIYSLIAGLAVVAGGYNMFDPASVGDINAASPRMLIVTSLSAVAGYFIYAVYASGLTAAYLEIKDIKEGGTTLGDVFA